MTLPSNGTQWPPKHLNDVTARLAEWSAWYDGSPERLREVYARTQGARFDRPAQRRGGVVGAFARFWWGRPIDDATTAGQRIDQLHVPIAADICQASSDLLYAEPPTLTVDDTTTQDRLAQYVDDGLHTILASGAEIGAALGGRYHRVTWDRTLHADRPFLTTVDADAALPEFRWDHLVAVTFWHVLEVEGQTVTRHLERHELDAAGNGLILHGLYVGTPGDLGRAVPLTENPITAPLATAVDETGALIEGRTPGLCVEYIPNQRPQRRWRTHPVGKSLGRSDLDGIEGPMDALDEAYSSWMRDLRLAKGRIFIPDYLLTAGRPGEGASFNLDQEAFVPLHSAAPEDGDAKLTLNQFSIRVAEHQATCQELTEVILRSAGYSSATFGEASDGAPMTATEVSARERRSYLTRDRKIRLEKPGVGRILGKMLAIDHEVFNTPLTVQAPQVAFGDAIQESPLLLAQTTLAMDTARAASIETKVRTLHPDWDDTRVATEVAELRTEQAPKPAVDPFAITA